MNADTPRPSEAYLRPTPVIDSNHPSVQAKSWELTRGVSGAARQAVNLFYFVRDEVRYNFYPPPLPPEEMFRASHTLEVREGFCIPKAILLIALARAAGVPGALGFADIRNHRLSEKARMIMGTTEIRLHGYAELYLDGRWVKVTPAFDRHMCEENRLVPVEFDGKSDAMLPARDADGAPHIEYLRERYHGVRDVHPQKLAEALMKAFEGRDFEPFEL